MSSDWRLALPCFEVKAQFLQIWTGEHSHHYNSGLALTDYASTDSRYVNIVRGPRYFLFFQSMPSLIDYYQYWIIFRKAFSTGLKVEKVKNFINFSYIDVWYIILIVEMSRFLIQSLLKNIFFSIMAIFKKYVGSCQTLIFI